MRKFIQRAADILDRSPEFFRADVRLFELNRRFLWFIVFRFVVVGVFLVLAVAEPIIIPHVSVSWEAFLVMAAVLLVANICYWFHYNRAVHYVDFDLHSKMLSDNVQVQIIVDFMVLGYLTYRCGGIESPLVYFFLLHDVISCLFFKKRISFLYTLLSLCIICFVSLAPLFGYLPAHHFIFPERSMAFYDKVVCFYGLTGISAFYIVVWFFVSNITDSLKLQEDRLQDKVRELIEMDEQKTRYMLVTTHELKAPFSSIQSYVNVLLEGYAGDLSEKVREILWKIKARCNILMRMITEMIQLANISSMVDKKEEVVMKKTDIVRLIDDAVRNVSEAAKAKELKLILPEDKTCIIDANHEQIDILFNNILSNAVNYCYPKTEIEISIKDSGDDLIVSVADKGIGIKKENLEKVFLEYFRTEEASVINKNSTGLGLSIARQIMAVHGGRVWIESEVKVGTTVFMEFPKRME